MSIHPTPSQARKIAEKNLDEPIEMLNLLEFSKGGSASYKQYMIEVEKYFQSTFPSKSQRPKVIWSSQFGSPTNMMIGKKKSEWDLAFVVHYPTRATFLKMVNDPAYRKISKLRTNGLKDSRLIECKPQAKL